MSNYYRFSNYITEQIAKIRTTCDKYKKENPTKAKDYKNQYPFLKKKGQLPYIYEILKWEETKEKFKFEDLISLINLKIIQVEKNLLSTRGTAGGRKEETQST